jgi:hypothetical protein
MNVVEAKEIRTTADRILVRLAVVKMMQEAGMTSLTLIPFMTPRQFNDAAPTIPDHR